MKNVYYSDYPFAIYNTYNLFLWYDFDIATLKSYKIY